MAKLIPDLNDCYSSMTLGEEKVAKVLLAHLRDDCWIWYNPPIPPENLEPDFIVLDPGRGLMIIEVKDWRFDTIEQASSDSVILITPDGTSEAKNPYKQAKSYAYAAMSRLRQQKALVHLKGQPQEGKLTFPCVAEVVLMNLTREELRKKELEEIFGSRSVLCQDEILKNVDSETFLQRLWSSRQFSLQTRLTLNQIDSICNSLCLKKPLNDRPVRPVQKVIAPTIPASPQDDLREEHLEEINDTPSIDSIPQELQTEIDALHQEDTEPNPPNPVINNSLNGNSEETESKVSNNQTFPETKSVTYISQKEDVKSNSPSSSSDDLSSNSSKKTEGEISTDSTSSKIETLQDNHNPAPITPPSNKRLVLARVFGIVIALAGLGLGIKSLPYFLHPKLQVSSLTIGTLGSPEYQTDLADYLKEQFVPSNYWQFLTGKKIKVVIDGDKTLPYQEAERRIENQEWDIAFTLSPVISVAAKDNSYTFAAKMFPSSKSYQSALFVKSNSPIQSIDDIKPSTILALGGANSASSFYMPSYDLYGKKLTLDMGHRGSEILELVKTGRADVGAAAVGDTVKADDPSIRIIHQSRDIPSSGIYLSPKLSTSDRQTLKSVLLSAPQDIQKKANYGAGEEPDYSFFREIIAKAESVQICADFTKNPVNLFCADTYQPVTVAGKVNGWSLRANARILNLRESSGKTYRVAVSPQLLAEAIGNSEPIAIQGKQIQVKTSSTPQQLADGSFELKLTQARQLKILAITSRSATN